MKGSRPCVAVLGGGQLARMLALAGHRLGIQTRVIDPISSPCAADVAEHIEADYWCGIDLDRLLCDADVLTFEFENVPTSALSIIQMACLGHNVAIRPGLGTLQVAQDRIHEKGFGSSLGIPTTRYAKIDKPEDASAALEITGLPAILKTRRMGYDGKSQQRVETVEQLADAVTALGGTDLILEAMVQGSVPDEQLQEWSVVAVRERNGSFHAYPLIENRHKNAILRVSRVDYAPSRPRLERQAFRYAQKLMDELEYVGVMTVEFFEREGELLFNEMAPRVHNSGHWTIDAAETSQFENHLRAILGLPIGPTNGSGFVGMVNLIGDWVTLERIATLTHGAAIHLYGKEPRPGRKVGHFTMKSPYRQAREAWIDQVIRNSKELREALAREGDEH